MTAPTTTTTTAPPDLAPLPDVFTITELNPDDAGRLCEIMLGDPGPLERCPNWATHRIVGMCSKCWRPLAGYACQGCADDTVELYHAQPELLRSGCCGMDEPRGLLLIDRIVKL